MRYSHTPEYPAGRRGEPSARQMDVVRRAVDDLCQGRCRRVEIEVSKQRLRVVRIYKDKTETV